MFACMIIYICGDIGMYIYKIVGIINDYLVAAPMFLGVILLVVVNFGVTFAVLGIIGFDKMSPHLPFAMAGIVLGFSFYTIITDIISAYGMSLLYFISQFCVCFHKTKTLLILFVRVHVCTCVCVCVYCTVKTAFVFWAEDPCFLQETQPICYEILEDAKPVPNETSNQQINREVVV